MVAQPPSRIIDIKEARRYTAKLSEIVRADGASKPSWKFYHLAESVLVIRWCAFGENVRARRGYP